MSENKKYSLFAVAKELNIGMHALADTLHAKGAPIDGKPTPVTKINEEQYNILLKEFDTERTLKQKAEQVELNVRHENDHDRSRFKETHAPSPVSVPTPIPASVIQPAAPVVQATAVVPETVAETLDATPEPVTAKHEPIPIPIPEVHEPVPELPEPGPEADIDDIDEPDTVQETTPASENTIPGLKVMGHIEIPKDDGGRGKGKKPVKKKDSKGKAAPAHIAGSQPDTHVTKPQPKTPAVEAKHVAKPLHEPVPPKTEPVEPVAPEPVEEIPVETVKTQFVKLDGPKVQGKIDLTSINTKKGDYRDIIRGGTTDDKKKRERIKVFKKISIDEVAKQEEKKRTTSAPAGGNMRRDRNKPVNQKEVKSNVNRTMANMSAGSGKSARSKTRRTRREENAGADGDNVDYNVLEVTEFISASDLANLLDVSVTDIIQLCMGLGMMVSINQRLDAEVIELIAGEYGKSVKFITVEEQLDAVDDEADEEDELLPRAPIVTIMGHVDHGKTSLLDYIRNANVVAGEMGGITQHIGAYEVTLKDGRNITFLDTPGHEAFTAMRARGAKVTDVAVIVIAADDAIMPQTREAISHAQAAGVPMVFAFNKIDKPGANPEKIREQLSSMNILPEEWGGTYQTQEISAKSGLNIDLLMDKILLQAEMLELKANPNRHASGVVIEATLEKGKGYVSTLLVQKGTMKIGDFVLSGQHYGKVKAMQDERGNKVKVAGPSTPAQILGLEGAPSAGDTFRVMADEREAKEIATRRQQILREQGIRTKKHITLDEIGRRLALGSFRELKVIVKGDYDGSVEALSDSLLKLSTAEVQINIVHKAVGQITESDVLLASASDAIIVGFQVRPSANARKLAEKENIEIRLYSIIYNAIEELKSAMEGLLAPTIEEKIVANLEVLNIFKIEKVGTVAGCTVTDGKMTRNNKIRLVRDGIVVYTGELSSLKRYKDDAKEVTSGMECGLTIKNFNDIKPGDIVEAFEETEVKRTL